MRRPLLILGIFLRFTFSYTRLRGSVITSPLHQLLILLGFNDTTGAVVLGPAAPGLAPINIKLEANGGVTVEN